MKTTKFLTRITHSALLLFILLFVISACRKDDPMPDPVDPIPTDPAVPVVFSNKPLQMLTEYEKANNLEFPGHRLFRTGTIMSGKAKEIYENFGEIGDLLWEMEDYKITESRFDQIDEEIDGLTGQIKILNENITAMQDLMGVRFDDMENQINYTNLKSSLDAIDVQMNGADHSHFGWYSNVAAAYQADTSSGAANMLLAKSWLPTYASSMINATGGFTMDDCITSLYTFMCPDLSSQADKNILNGYAKTIIDNCKGMVTDTAKALQAYSMLESYFLSLVSYQFQAASIMVNAANYDTYAITGDTSGNAGKTYWNETIGTYIPKEIVAFQDAVDFLVTNLSEYRTDARFTSDMQYAAAGLAPDSIFYHALGRSQFICNLLNKSLGKPYPVICGHIMIPNNYSSDGIKATTIKPVTVKVGSATLGSTAKTHKSIIPYTYWDNTKTCHPENDWNSYRFSTAVSDSVWQNGPQPVQVVTGDQATPWPHSVDIAGSTTPLYYNLDDITMTSPTRTAECTFQFGYFSANWQWGYLLLSHTKQMTNLPSPFNIDHYLYDFDNSEFKMPFAGPVNTGNDAYGNVYYEFYPSSEIQFTASDNCTGSLKANGKITTTDKKHPYYVIGDARYLKVYTGSDKPTTNNAQNILEAWGCYKGTLSTAAPVNDETVNIKVSLGTHWNNDNSSYFMVGDILKDDISIVNSLTALPTHFGNKVGVELGQSFHSGIQYLYSDKVKHSSQPFSVEINAGMQFVYQGAFELQ